VEEALVLLQRTLAERFDRKKTEYPFLLPSFRTPRTLQKPFRKKFQVAGNKPARATV